METFHKILIELKQFFPLFGVMIISSLALYVVNKFFEYKQQFTQKHTYIKNIIFIILILSITISLLIALPVSVTTKSDLVTLLGIVLSAILTLASTTFVGNAFAGYLLKTVTHFKPGNFIHVGKEFGRVTEQGFFHTEIQTEESNLMTLPNLYLVTQPVTVIRTTNTLITSEVSLGYDVPHLLVENILMKAATEAGLDDPFVRILSLGDFSITYQCAGMLNGVKNLLAARSRLRGKMLDLLHGEGIEIVSPAFMNQRRLAEDRMIAPEPGFEHKIGWARIYQGPRDDVVFDKAERASIVEEIKDRITNSDKELVNLKVNLAKTEIES